MTTTVASIIERANDLLQDIGSVRWAQAELLRWINDGQREIVINRHDANTVNVSVALAAGTKQTLPAGGISLIDIPRNMGVGGTTPGRAVRVIKREDMDLADPSWHTSTAKTEVRHFMFDERNPLNFYVYPPVPATPAVQVEIIYATSPTDCALGGNLNLPDIFSGAIVDYLIYRALSKDAEHAANLQRATLHYQAFASALGLKRSEDSVFSPNRQHA